MTRRRSAWGTPHRLAGKQPFGVAIAEGLDHQGIITPRVISQVLEGPANADYTAHKCQVAQLGWIEVSRCCSAAAFVSKVRM
jgi:hypothetical protein